MKKYNIIGDIHGRTTWKDLVIEDGINIFVGDYFDPYDRILPDDLIANLMDIILFKSSHPETILLFGNHDYCTYYLRKDRYSRFDSYKADDYRNVFTENVDMFNGFAYNIGNRYMITHAGVTKNWRDKRLPEELDTDNLEATKTAINSLFGEYTPFSFEDNSDWSDSCGDALQQSPLWIRPLSLLQVNLWKDKDVVQVVGHTQLRHIHKQDNVVLVDVLGTVTQSFIVEDNEDGTYNEFIQTVEYDDNNNVKNKTVKPYANNI